jgi:PIN domain nuclease of toxin-antitoxin system
MNELNFKNKLNQRKLTPNKKIVKHKVTQFQLAIISLFEIEILSSTHR